MRAYDYYRDRLTDRELPAAFVDLDALDRNADAVAERAGGLPIRIASKSIRCPAVMERLLDRDAFAGVMCYHGREAAFLAAEGFDDLLVAYPVPNRAEIEAVCEAVANGTTVTLMVDSAEHVERAADAAAAVGVTLPLCLDVDMSSEHFGIHFGTRRSPVRTAAEALAVANAVDRHDAVTLDGVMGYEGQIAGLPDRDPSNSAPVNAAIRFLKGRSERAIAGRRGAVVAALEDRGFDLRFVNGGGTGSLEYTRTDPAVTELTVGSGFYVPRQFDYYDAFDHVPAAGYAVEIARRPADGIYTCRGGGYVASGPPGESKAPTVALPEDATLTDTEGAGEVQTPVVYDGPVDLSLGDPVLLRHGKAGELCRNFESLALLADGRETERARTYRGAGQCFV